MTESDALARFADAWLGAGAREGELTAEQIEWVVNDNAELGVKIGDQFFWLYKGDSLVYEDGKHDNGMPMYWRHVSKREFGECCHPVHLTRLPDRYTDGDGWQELPCQRGEREKG